VRAAEPRELTEADGAKVGEFLRTLHDLPLVELGLTVSPDDQFAPTVDSAGEFLNWLIRCRWAAAVRCSGTMCPLGR
jgi:hypothetical protein